MTDTTDPALLTLTAIGGNDGRRPMLMGVIAHPAVGYFYGHLERWSALWENRHLGKPVRLRDARTDMFDEAGELTREGKVDVLARLEGDHLVLYHGRQAGLPVRAREDVGTVERYPVDLAAFETFARACGLTARNDRAVNRLVIEISQRRRAADVESMVVDVSL
ncbi:hypothetical protein [uncultured Rhodospira sp.]|uniref:hypothetical protein n=1 Tax=uncultured Rhodospira sp. TaxID=1936189 RepID=UPI00261ADE92|nr:hypothetical protein [uncultured Rhodospira sp.]